jgi:epoxyqueuosine reductase
VKSRLDEALRKIAQEQGADLFGVADVESFKKYEGKRHPSFYIPDAKSVLVIGIHMYDPVLDAWIQPVEEKKEYYVVNEILGSMCAALEQFLISKDHHAILSPYSGVFTKDAGVLAGLGIIGKNNLLVTEHYGPRVRMRAIITDARLAPTAALPRISCDGCPRHCWSACPANAFSDGYFHRDVCSEYSEKNLKWLSPHTSLYCRECELACPISK